MAVHSYINQAQDQFPQASSTGFLLPLDQFICPRKLVNFSSSWIKVPFFIKLKNELTLLHKNVVRYAKTEKVQCKYIFGHILSHL